MPPLEQSGGFLYCGAAACTVCTYIKRGVYMEYDVREDKFIRMTTKPVKGLVCSMAVPSIISMLVTAIYNLADTFFVGKISTQATGAIGIVFSYMALIQAIAFFFGHGCGNYISRELGKHNVEGAQKMASLGFFTALATGVLIGAFGFIFMRPLLSFLGATDTIMPEAIRYFRYILCATPFIMGSFVLNNVMRMQGNAKLAVIGIASGALLNIGLDPLLITVAGMKTAGAGLATAISQTVSFVLLIFLSRMKDGIKIRIADYRFRWSGMLEILAGGLPSLARQGMASIATMCLNNAAKPYGDPAIAAMSVVSRVTMIASSALIGFGQGFQPVCGFNYGAKLYGRVKEAFWFCVRVATVAMSVIGVVMYINAEPIIGIFRKDDAELTMIAVQALRYQCMSMPIVGFVVMSNMFLQNTRKTVRATVIAMARQGLMFIPVLFILEHLLEFQGIELTQTVADILSFVLAIPLSISAIREMSAHDTAAAGR